MAYQQALHLSDRVLLEISGTANKDFLQGLITNDINNLNKENCILSAFLNPQGRFLADFFLYEYRENIIIDINTKFKDEFLKKLNIYKLKSDVQILWFGIQIFPIQNRPIKIFNIFKLFEGLIWNRNLI